MDGQRKHGEWNVLLRERVATDNLTAIRDMIDDRAVRHGLPRDDVQRFVLADNEAATNAIRHATGTAEVIVRHDGTRLVAEIRDDGPGIDPPQHPTLPEAEALSGRGLWLMHELDDRVSIVNASGGAVVRLEVSCAPDGDR